MNNEERGFFRGLCWEMVKVGIDGDKDFWVGFVFEVGGGGNRGGGRVGWDEG